VDVFSHSKARNTELTRRSTTNLQKETFTEWNFSVGEGITLCDGKTHPEKVSTDSRYRSFNIALQNELERAERSFRRVERCARKWREKTIANRAKRRPLYDNFSSQNAEIGQSQLPFLLTKNLPLFFTTYNKPLQKTASAYQQVTPPQPSQKLETASTYQKLTPPQLETTSTHQRLAPPQLSQKETASAYEQVISPQLAQTTIPG
jgi:hypothetical protein